MGAPILKRPHAMPIPPPPKPPAPTPQYVAKDPDCKSCGAYLSVFQARCEYCRRPNPDYISHLPPPIEVNVSMTMNEIREQVGLSPLNKKVIEEKVRETKATVGRYYISSTASEVIIAIGIAAIMAAVICFTLL